MRVALIAFGGAFGPVSRSGLAAPVPRTRPHTFPFGTFVVNMVGSLVFGLIAGWSEFRTPLSDEARALLFVGVLGGFTTFSSFGYETFLLLRQGHGNLALLNAVGQLLLGVAAVWLGW